MQTVVGAVPFSAHHKGLSLKCIHLSVDKQNNCTLSLQLYLPANTDAKGSTNEVGVGHLATTIHTHTHTVQDTYMCLVLDMNMQCPTEIPVYLGHCMHISSTVQ